MFRVVRCVVSLAWYIGLLYNRFFGLVVHSHSGSHVVRALLRFFGEYWAVFILSFYVVRPEIVGVWVWVMFFGDFGGISGFYVAGV